MSKEKIKELIDAILMEKQSSLLAKIDSIKNNVVSNFEELVDLGDLQSYTIPDDLNISDSSPDEAIQKLHQFIKKISSSVNQLNLINNLLEGINQYCSRAALFLVRDDKLVGWNGRGFSDKDGEISDNDIKKIFFSLSANTIFKHVLESKESYSGAPSSKPDDHLIQSRLGGVTPENIFVLPFFVKGKPQAVIYTDILESGHIGEKEIEMISTVGEMSLDLLPLRQKILAKVKTKEFVEEPKAEISVEEPEEEEEVTMTEMEMDKEETLLSVRESDPERLARVIINDIILYNQKKVEDGIKNKNLYQIMKDTILQSKELYLNRFNDLSAFEKQLLENLAKGDRSALEGYKFETI